MKKETQEDEIVFVFIGKNLPKYAVSSLALAGSHSGMAVRLVGNKALLKQLPRKFNRFTAIEDFYSDRRFKQASTKLSMSHTFRGGFWLKALERFFVLEQYWESTGRNDILHAELDQLLFGIDGMLHELRGTTRRGLFLPFHSAEAAVASVFYANRKESLSEFLDFATSGVEFPNEMKLFALWGQIVQGKVHALPTLPTLIGFRNDALGKNVDLLSADRIKGVVDAAQLGQWIAGIDPRNLPLKEVPRNKFVDAEIPEILSKSELESLRFEFDPLKKELRVSINSGASVRLYNLHIHSKVHSWLEKTDPYFANLIALANSPESFTIPGTRRQQVTSIWNSRVGEYANLIRRKFLKLIFLIRSNENVLPFVVKDIRRLLRKIRRRYVHSYSPVAVLNNLRRKKRPSSAPYISGDGFRSQADYVWEGNSPELPLERIPPRSIVFCEGDKVDGFIEAIDKEHSGPFVLLLGNSDQNFDRRLSSLAAAPYISRIFAQNLLDEVPGVVALPIGLENAWRAKHGRTRRFTVLRKRPARMRLHRIMWTFTVSTNSVQREEAAHALASLGVADYIGEVSPKTHAANLRNYSFVASPPGNGEDTHRTWEAMYLGCVPIVLRSYMTESFEALNLPIWIVDSYQDLIGLTESDLAQKYSELGNRFQSSPLWLDYWRDEILPL